MIKWDKCHTVIPLEITSPAMLWGSKLRAIDVMVKLEASILHVLVNDKDKSNKGQP